VQALERLTAERSLPLCDKRTSLTTSPALGRGGVELYRSGKRVQMP
jgi:hypothetical protein